MPGTTRPLTTMPTFRRHVRLVAASSVLVAVGLGGCSADSSDASSAEVTYAPAETAARAVADDVTVNERDRLAVGAAAPAQAPVESASAAGGRVEDIALPDPTTIAVGRNQIKTASITVRVERDKFRAAVDRATVEAGAVGGFVSAATVSGGELLGVDNDGVERRAPRYASISMRVPAERFDAVRTTLKGLGEVASEELSGQEVSRQLIDNEARLRSLRLQEDAYRKLFDRADRIADIVAVQQQLTDVRTQIEQLSAGQAALRDQVSLSTITLGLQEVVPDASPVVEPTSTAFGDRVGDTWRDALSAVGSILAAIVIAAVAAAPFLPFVVVVGLLVRWAMRRNRRPVVAPAAPAPVAAVERVDERVDATV